MSDNPGGNQMHPWDPHKAAKDIEVGDYYLKVRKNYRAAEDRYREALYYKENDAVATYGLAVSLEKLNRTEEARQEYETYLKILPEGSEAKNARKALARLKDSTGNLTPDK
jgi:Flp pilus assembly protein TadD